MTKNLRKRKHLKLCLIALLLPSGLGVIRINKKVLLHVGVLNTTYQNILHYQQLICFLACLFFIYIENNTWAHEDMEFLFECSPFERGRYRIEHEKRKSMSPSN